MPWFLCLRLCGLLVYNYPTPAFFTVQSVSTSAWSFIGQAAAVCQVNNVLQATLSSYKNCGWESCEFKKNNFSLLNLSITKHQLIKGTPLHNYINIKELTIAFLSQLNIISVFLSFVVPPLVQFSPWLYVKITFCFSSKESKLGSFSNGSLPSSWYL